MRSHGLMLKRNLRGVVGKLNQQKNWIIENLHQSFVLLSAERSSQFSECQNIGVSHYEKWVKMAIAPQKRILEQNFQLLIILNLGLWFSKCKPKQKIGVSHYEKWGKNGHSSPKMHLRAKLPITDPLKFMSPVFWVSMETENWCQSSWKWGKCQ